MRWSAPTPSTPSTTSSASPSSATSPSAPPASRSCRACRRPRCCSATAATAPRPTCATRCSPASSPSGRSPPGRTPAAQEVGAGSRRFRPATLVAAAAAVIALGVGGPVVWQQVTDDQTSQPPTGQRRRPGPRRRRRRGVHPDPRRGTEVTIVRSPSLNQAVLVTDDMRSRPSARSTSCGSTSDDEGMVPAGLMTGDRGARSCSRVIRPPLWRRHHHRARRAARRSRRCRRHDLRLRERLMRTPRHVAVIGSGVAGLLAAHVAARTAHVTLLEADDRMAATPTPTRSTTWRSTPASSSTTGGPTRPCCASSPSSVFETQESGDVAVGQRRRDRRRVGRHAGSRGLFPTTANLRRPAYLRMLTEIPASTAAPVGCSPSPTGDEQTLRDFLAEGRFTPYFERHFMEPVVAAVWSCDPAVALDYPAATCSPSSSTTGCSRCSARRRGPAPSAAGPPASRLGAGLGAGLPDARTGTKVTLGAGGRRGRSR